MQIQLSSPSKLYVAVSGASSRHFMSEIGAKRNLETEHVTTLRINEIRKKGLRILLIDDDDKFRKSLCFKLTRIYKANVDDVDRGLKGLEKLTAGNIYDLVITDIMMAEMTGIEVYRALRKIDAKVKVVIMSAYSSSDEWKKALDLKGPMLLHKPIPNEDLLDIMSDL